ncbi:MAG: hypothetical protein PHO90_01860, partial [Candidatus Pacebacteria bacterium]|nr:hypothetical protein [Candidatus Paceibacterota bacterium]
LENAIEFMEVKIDGKKINFIPDQRVECPTCLASVNNPYGLVFPAGEGVDLTISSDQFIKTIEFVESNDSTASYVFWK